MQRTLRLPNYRVIARQQSAEIFLYDDIGDGFFGGITSKQVINDLAALGPVKTLTVRINSAGGSVFEGFAIYNAFARFPSEVNVEIDGIAASIASIIAMVGKDIRVAENAMVMIHDPMAFVAGTGEDMRKMADSLDAIRGNLVKTYAKRTGQDQQKVSDWMAAETWMDANDAVAYGFADSVSQPLALAASADLTRFKNVPARLAKASAAPRPQSEMRAAKLAALLRTKAST